MKTAAAVVGLVVLAACRSTVPPLVASPGATITATPASVAIGESIELLVSTPAADASLDWSGLPAGLEARGPVDRFRNRTGWHWRWKVTSFTPGALDIPSMPVRTQATGSSPPVVVSTSPVTVRFVAPPVTAEDALRPISSRLSPRPPKAWPAIVAAVAGVVVAGAMSMRAATWYRASRQRRRRWHAVVERFQRYEAALDGGSGETARATCHAAAVDFRRFLGVAIDRRIPFRTTGDVEPLLRGVMGGTAVALEVVSVLRALEGERFGPDFDRAAAARSVGHAAQLIRRLRSTRVDPSPAPTP